MIKNPEKEILLAIEIDENFIEQLNVDASDEYKNIIWALLTSDVDRNPMVFSTLVKIFSKIMGSESESFIESRWEYLGEVSRKGFIYSFQNDTFLSTELAVILFGKVSVSSDKWLILLGLLKSFSRRRCGSEVSYMIDNISVADEGDCVFCERVISVLSNNSWKVVLQNKLKKFRGRNEM